MLWKKMENYPYLNYTNVKNETFAKYFNLDLGSLHLNPSLARIIT